MSNGLHKDSTGSVDRWVKRIEQDTERLRIGTDPVLRRIRDLIGEHGVEVGQSLVANLMPEDTNVVSGFIVGATGSVYEFEYDWRRAEPDQGRLVVWRDITNAYQSRAFREPISAAAAMIRRLKEPATVP